MLESRTCPLPMVSDESHVMVRLYRHYKAQHLPFAGGVLEQPAAYLDAMELLGSAFAEIERDLLKGD